MWKASVKSVANSTKMGCLNLALEVAVVLEVAPVAEAVLLVQEELDHQEQGEHLLLVPKVEVLELKSSCTEILVPCQVLLLETGNVFCFKSSPQSLF
jgi:hypothetical protein